MAAGAGGEKWSTQFGFLMAAIGSSVGLGNFWRFPYTAGENGGAIFILVYLLCIVLIAYPVLVSEYAIGRRGGKSSVGSVRAIAVESGASKHWSILSFVGMAGAFLILSFYSMIAAWVIAYIIPTFSGTFSAMVSSAESTEAARQAISQHYASVTGDKTTIILLHAVFMGVTALIVARGISGGIERASKILMPAFFVMLVGVVIFGAIAGDFGKAATYLFNFDFSGITGAGFLKILQDALGQAFFSVGVGVALMVTYGSYLKKEDKIVPSSTIVAGSDTLVALIAGLAIFPMVFAVGIDPTGGPGLFFVTLPNVFGQMPGGAIIGGLFFTLSLFAALTSAISLLEVSVAWVAEKIGRMPAALAMGGLCWAVGLGSIMSGEFFGFVDKLTEAIMLPLGGLLVALFAGWAIKREVFRDELTTSAAAFGVWRFLIRFVAPIGCAVIVLFGLRDFTVYFGGPNFLAFLGI